MLDRPGPAGHAYDATLWLLAGHVGRHTILSAIMLCYLAARVAAGYASPSRIGEAGIVKLWADFTVATGLVALAAAWLPGAFCMIDILRLSLPITVWLTGFSAVYALAGAVLLAPLAR